MERLLGFPEQTVYDWLDVVAERDATALGDLPRPGQSTRLTEERWSELTATLAASPSEAGYNDPTWTPALVRNHIAETFDVEYSLTHMYRVIKRARLSYQTARPRHYKADPAEQQRWREEFKKSGRR
ncbi:winged helix-turn-helix domain-containing protein [Halobellus sp. EA9]|uniref:winged helix-turn-helix domain-containing protein n=1 Tax=Halobellus sp. EA9 TaxID=3421647 RepID=UPI003EB88F18